MSEKKENIVVAYLRIFWKYIGATMTRKIFFFAVLASTFLFILFQITGWRFVFFGLMLSLAVSVITSIADTLLNQKAFRAEVEKIKKERFAMVVKDVGRMSAREMKEFKTLSEKEQKWINKKLAGFRISLLIKMLLGIFLVIIFMQAI